MDLEEYSPCGYIAQLRAGNYEPVLHCKSSQIVSFHSGS